MSILCISCQQAELRAATVKLAGVVRSEPYWVEMNGLKCPNCGYSTVGAKGMTEFSRLLSDQYRSAHGLLTSNEIVALRHQFKESQEEFAEHVGVGVASIKRWELGKIQDKRSDDSIRGKTRPQVTNTVQSVQYQPNASWNTIPTTASGNLLPASGGYSGVVKIGWFSWDNVVTDEVSKYSYGPVLSDGTAEMFESYQERENQCQTIRLRSHQ